MLISAASMAPETAGRRPQGPPAPPPPLLPKPGKDNLRLQKLLRKAAHKKMAGGRPSAPPGAFRTSLSPVSEASHDQETTAPRPAEASRVAATLPCTPDLPLTHHVASPVKKFTLSLSVTQRGSPSPHSKAPEALLTAPTPEPPRSSGGFAHVSVPVTKGAHHSQTHILLGLSPQDRTPGLPRRGPDGGCGGQEKDAALGPTGGQSPILAAHICSFPTGAQGGRPWLEGPPLPRQPPGSQALGPRETSPQAVVPTAPAYRPLGTSPPRPAPVPPKAECLQEHPTAGPVVEAERISKLQGALCPTSPSSPDSCPVPQVTPKPQPSSWTRLKKHLMEEVKEPPCPEPEPSPQRAGQEQDGTAPTAPGPPASRPSRLWDAVLYRMAVAGSRGSSAGPQDRACASAGRGCLPCMCRPRFNARKLQEAATRPPPTIQSILERSPQPKNFNRTAAGWRLH